MSDCGATTTRGDQCELPAGWGTDADDGPCRHHRESVRSDRQGARELPWGDIQRRRILEALRDGATYEVAARSAGISPRTFRRWRNRHPRLREAVERAEAESASDALGVVSEAAQQGDWRAASWLLERRHGYDDTDALDDETVRAFVDCVKATIRERFDDCTDAGELIDAIGGALTEATDA